MAGAMTAATWTWCCADPADLDKIDASRLAEFTEALRDSPIPFLVEARRLGAPAVRDNFQREERDHVVSGGGKMRAQSITRRLDVQGRAI